MPKVKITVIKKMNNAEIYGQNQPARITQDMLSPECSSFKIGQEFIIDTDPKAPPEQYWGHAPPGFCAWAFADIQRDITHILFGGSFPWIDEKGVAISCCTDGLRPVVFRIERIAD